MARRTARQRARVWLHMARAAVGAYAPIEIAFRANTSTVSAASTYTYNNQTFGPAATNRWLVIGIAYRAAATVTITSVTIGGASATVNAFNNNTSGGNTSATAIAAAYVPTGATGSVVIVFSGNIARASIVIWSALNLARGSANHTAVTSTAAAADTSTTINKYGRGGVFAIEFYSNANTPDQRVSAASEQPIRDEAGAAVSVTNVDDVATWTGLGEVVDAQIQATATVPQSMSIASWKMAV